MRSKQIIADNESQYRISEKLELFVVCFNPAFFIRVRAMRQRLREQFGVLKGVAQSGLQIVYGAHRGSRRRPLAGAARSASPRGRSIKKRQASTHWPILAPADWMYSSRPCSDLFLLTHSCFRTSRAPASDTPFRKTDFPSASMARSFFMS